MNEHKPNRVYREKDKSLVPFLWLVKGVDFIGTEKNGTTTYFKFSPEKKVRDSIQSFYSRSADPVQPKDLMDSIERFKNEIFRINIEEKRI